MEITLLIGREVDRLFRWPRGRAARLARAGKFPHIKLPDGEIRFNAALIGSLLRPRGVPGTEEAPHAN